MTKSTTLVCAQRRLRSAWASAQSDQSLRCALKWVVKDPRFLHADSEDSDQTGRMPRLIWVFTGRTVILLVLSWGGSFHKKGYHSKHKKKWVCFTDEKLILHVVLHFCGISKFNSLRKSPKIPKWTTTECQYANHKMKESIHLSHVTRNPVFGVCDQVRLKPVCSATEAS